MFKVFRKEGEQSLIDKKVFTNPFEASRYFDALTKKRTPGPGAVVLTDGNLQKRCYRTDEDYPDDARMEHDDFPQGAPIRQFAVFRNGSNSVNQPMTQRALIWTGEAKDEEDAKLRARRGGAKIYNNQSLDAIPVDELDAEDRAEYDDQQQVTFLQPFSLPTSLHTAMKLAAAQEGKSLKDWRLEAYREKLAR
jgi:hypothetical protein